MYRSPIFVALVTAALLPSHPGQDGLGAPASAAPMCQDQTVVLRLPNGTSYGVTRARLSFIFDPTSAPHDWRVRCNLAAMDVGGFDLVYGTDELVPELDQQWQTPVRIGVLYEKEWFKSGFHERAEYLMRRDGRPSPVARSGQTLLFEIPGVALVGTQFFMLIDGDNPLKGPVRATMICSAAQYGDCRATIPWRDSTSIHYIFQPMTLDDDKKKVDPQAFIELDKGVQATLSELVRPAPRDQRKRGKELAKE